MDSCSAKPAPQILTLYTIPVTYIYFERFFRSLAARLGALRQPPQGAASA